MLIYNQNRERPERNTDLVNENIRFPEVLVIGPNGEQLGVMKTRAAIDLASNEYELDLYCVNPNGKPPVCKMLNYSKYRFEQQKRAKEQKRKQKIVELKEIRMSPVIDVHDQETKARTARRFLEEGNKVKVTIRYRGRQMAHIEVGEKILESFVQSLEELATVERKPVLEGRNLSVILASKIKK
ncbi:MAG: Translation initiation factor IF-3 [Tenericutes bacterium ADurb.Bin239]|nr:MAG: Translation initiation factor IF-3 [Tenericutes bacterium ADurb.Bin239]